MSESLPLSARVAALEQAAAPLDDLYAERAALMERVNDLGVRILAGEQAAGTLRRLDVYALQVLDGAAPELTPVEVIPVPVAAEGSPPPAPPIANVGGRQYRRIQAWVDALPEGVTYSAEEVARTLGTTEASTRVYLRAHAREGTLEHVPGTGRPVRYRKATSGGGETTGPAPAVTPAPEPVAAPVALTTPPAPKAKALTLTQLPRELPPLTTASEASPADCDAIVAALRAHGRPMSQSMLQNRLPRTMKHTVLVAGLSALNAAGTVVQTPEHLYDLAERSA